MTRVYVGNLDPRVDERELEDEFKIFGVVRSVWVARRPPGYAFLDFDDERDALDAIRALDGKNGWRVELSHKDRGGRGGGGSGGRRGVVDDSKCYECGEPGHFARECRRGRGSYGRRRSPSPRRRSSPSYGYPRRSISPRGRRSPPRRRSVTPPRRGRSYSRSPPYRALRRDSPRRRVSPYGRRSPYANGNSVSKLSFKLFSNGCLNLFSLSWTIVEHVGLLSTFSIAMFFTHHPYHDLQPSCFFNLPPSSTSLSAALWPMALPDTQLGLSPHFWSSMSHMLTMNPFVYASFW
ncbi:unnamed protein product [Cochlearia groenlandica]